MSLSDDQIKALLVKAKLADQNQLQEIAEYARNAQMSLIDAILEKDVTTDQNLGNLIAGALKMPFVVLAKLSLPEDIARIVPEKIARRYKVIPFARDQSGIKVAMADPSNALVQEMLSKKTGQNVVPYYATERDIYNKLWVYRKDLQKTFDALVSEQLKSTGKTTTVEAPIAKIVALIINFAYQDRASDLHIEPEEKDTLVRFRVDGILHDVLFLPKKIHDQVVTRIKVLSSLRTDEHLAPQDGKMRIELEEE
ncbi:MAG TPA: ATPase, T2SS/T4P/T4SS family, partial [Patescibacteria group bacterium]